MTVYTEQCIKQIIMFANQKKTEYMGIRLPATLHKSPLYDYNINNRADLEIDILISELSNWGLIISSNHIVNDPIDIYSLKVDCSKYFYDRENREVDLSKYPIPDYLKHFVDYDTPDDNHINPPEATIISNNQIKLSRQEILDINTNNLIIQIKKEVEYKRSSSINIEELSYNNTITGKNFDYNTLYDYLNGFAYAVNITIDDSDPDKQTTKISFSFMSK